MNDQLWILPEGVEDILPNHTLKIEQIKKKLTKQIKRRGYKQVSPALLESLQSSNINTNNKLNDYSFKLSDPNNGKIISLRVDMTTQVARIDARITQSKSSLNINNIERFFYIGHIFRGKSNFYKSSRTPIQLGAEIYGHSGIESDLEVMELAIQLLAKSGYSDFVIDLGHINALNKIIQPIITNKQTDSTTLNAIIKQKSLTDLAQIINPSNQQYKNIADLITLIGDETVLEKLNNRFNNLAEELTQIKKVISALKQRIAKKIKIHFHIDLSRSHNYQYHNGLIFNILDAQNKVNLAKGGRYDGIGKPFGSTRAATGFSMFIDQLNLDKIKLPSSKRVFIAYHLLNAPNLKQKIKQLTGQIKAKNCQIEYIHALDKNQTAKDFNCDYVLSNADDNWQLIKQ